ncbi:MAG: S46 family peptidase [Oceanococcus sp.]
MRQLCRRGLIGLVFGLVWTCSYAEEGMWTLDNLPRQALKQHYKFEPDEQWLNTVQKGTVRLAGGCSGSFVSAHGLVLTNHHCVSRCLAQLSGRQDNLLQNGYLAKTLGDEAICPEIELNQLLAIEDVSDSIRTVSEGLSQSQALSARRAAMSSLEQTCSENSPELRCDVVSLYDGARHHLYKYKRYQDVRLVFAPEANIAAFGGDPDNFSFPRYSLDMALLRAYQNGQAIDSPDFFPLQAKGAAIDELVFVSGHPGSTQRDYTAAQLVTLRDTILPHRLSYLSELRGVIRQYAQHDGEAKRITQRDYLSIQNTLKALRGQHAALAAPGFMQAQKTAENVLRERVEDERKLRKTTASAWDEIALAENVWAQIYLEYSLLERMRGYQSDLLAIAWHLVRAASERSKPNAQRLREYSEAALPQLTQKLFSAAPIHNELDILTLGWSLEKLRELLGPDHPAVRSSLGLYSPTELSEQLIKNTSLHDLATRRTLWDGGTVAIESSQDPLIQFARKMDSHARKVRSRYDDEVQAIIERNSKLISQAKFSLDGTDSYPDPSFSLRISYGQVQGWPERGNAVYPITTLSGLLARHTGRLPFAIPASWLSAEPQLDLTTPLNFTSTHDVIGGNSGSAMLNRKGELVGLIFDGNLHSLGGAYAYDGRYNRAISVHPAAMREALSTVYDADKLLKELFP